MDLPSKVLFSLCALSFAAQAQPVFVEGVSLDEGWYDSNKKSKWNWKARPTGYYYPDVWPDDVSMCWAHAATNVLQWWQDGQASAYVHPAAPNGASDTANPFYAAIPGTLGQQLVNDPLYVQQLAIFKDIAKNWGNTAGTVKQAYNWYFNGGHVEAFGGTLNNANSGGYYSTLGLVMNPDGVTSSLFTSYTFNDNFTRDVIIDTLTEYIDNDYGTTLRVIGAASAHAITMWGYEMSNDEFFVYLTDSDDYQHALIKQKVIFADDNYAYLTACDGDAAVYTDEWTTSVNGVQQTFQGIRLSEVQAFMGPSLNVPEPTTATLSLLALAALAARRRRK